MTATQLEATILEDLFNCVPPTSFILPLFLLLVGPLANIGTGQTSPSDDSYITSSKTAGNYGTGASLAVQAPGASSLIRFDLSGVPAGYTSANVAKASLKLYVSAVTANGSFNVDLVNSSWNEATFTFASSPLTGELVAWRHKSQFAIQ